MLRRLGNSSSSSSSSDAAKSAVVDRLLSSQLPNEIMIMNTMAPGEWPTDSTAGRRLSCLSTSPSVQHIMDCYILAPLGAINLGLHEHIRAQPANCTLPRIDTQQTVRRKTYCVISW